MTMDRCANCRDEHCILRRLPRARVDAILANPTGEYCLVFRTGSEVWKLAKSPLKARELWRFRLRDAISHAFPDLFAPAAFDGKALLVRQPFVAGRHANENEAAAANASVFAAGLQMVVDVSSANVIITKEGDRSIVDFSLDFTFHDELKAEFGIALEDPAIVTG